MTDIDDGIKKILNIVNSFLADIASDLAGIGGEISNIGTSVNGIEGSIMSALSFQNISLNVFGCDLKPKCAVSDFYNLQGGGGGSPQSQLPRLQEVDKNSRNGKKVSSTSQDPFATPLSTDIGTIYSMPSLI